MYSQSEEKVLNSSIGIAFSLRFNSKQAAFLKFFLLRVFLVHNGNKVMTEEFSFHDNTDFFPRII